MGRLVVVTACGCKCVLMSVGSGSREGDPSIADLHRQCPEGLRTTPPKHQTTDSLTKVGRMHPKVARRPDNHIQTPAAMSTSMPLVSTPQQPFPLKASSTATTPQVITSGQVQRGEAISAISRGPADTRAPQQGLTHTLLIHANQSNFQD